MAGNGGGGDGRLQIRCGDAHSEVKALTTLEGTCDVPSTGEVADDDFGTHGSQGVVTVDLVASYIKWKLDQVESRMPPVFSARS